MTFKVLDTRIVWGSNFPELMYGVEDMKKEGWEPLGTPTPLVLGDDYGMMHMVYRDRSRD